MAKNNNKPEVYKGRRKKLNVLGIVLSALAVLIVAVLVLFGAFQKYIVYQNSGISIDMPILRTPAPEDEQTDESGFAQVNAELEIRDADYSDIEEHVDEDMGSIRAVYVPPESVAAEGIGPYVSKLSSVGGNALVLDLKPVSGQLVWASSSKIAYDYGTAGTTDLASLVNSLKQQEIYLIAQLSCCTDELMVTRCPSAALTLPGGIPYKDEDGSWLDPYNSMTADYLTELCTELADMGFDELLLKNLAMPQTDATLAYTVQLSSVPNPVSAVCSLAIDLISQLESRDVLVSAILDTTSLRSGLSAQSGQDLSVFAKLFDRLCCSADTVWRATVDRDSVDYWMYEGDLSLRFVPIFPFADSGNFSCWIYKVPEGML